MSVIMLLVLFNLGPKTKIIITNLVDQSKISIEISRIELKASSKLVKLKTLKIENLEAISAVKCVAQHGMPQNFPSLSERYKVLCCS